jgi:hypothetical protein
MQLDFWVDQETFFVGLEQLNQCLGKFHMHLLNFFRRRIYHFVHVNWFTN